MTAMTLTIDEIRNMEITRSIKHRTIRALQWFGSEQFNNIIHENFTGAC